MKITKAIIALVTCLLLLAACNQQSNVTPVSAKPVVEDMTVSSKTLPSLETKPAAPPTSEMKSTTTEKPAVLKSNPVEIIGTPINNQSFASVPFEKVGNSEFISTIEKIDNKDRLHFYVKSPTTETELKYEPASPNSFYEMKAVAFKDVNADGWKDILIIADYTTGFGNMGAIPVSQLLIFTQTASGFAESKSLEEHVYSASPYRVLNIGTVLDLLKTDAKSGFSQAWSKLPLGAYDLDGSNKYRGSTVTIEKVNGEFITFSLSAFVVNGGDEGVEKGNVNIGDLKSVTANRSGSEMIYRDGDYELSISLISTEDFYLRDNGKPQFGLNVNVNGAYSHIDRSVR